MPLSHVSPKEAYRIVDISIPLRSDFRMHTPEGVADVQLEIDVIKQHDALGGAGQLVRGLRARLHHGTHVDAPEHFVRQGLHINDLPLTTFVGPAVVADLHHVERDYAIQPSDLESAIAEHYHPGDRLLIRTDWNDNYGTPTYLEHSPYLSLAAVEWCVAMHFPVVGMDFAHTKDPADAGGRFWITRRFCETGIVTMGYVANLSSVRERRVMLVALPLALDRVEASPVRAVVFEQTCTTVPESLASRTAST